MECGHSLFTEYLTISRRTTTRCSVAWALFFAGVALPVSISQGDDFTRPTYVPAVSESYFFGNPNEVYPNPYQSSPSSFTPSPGATRPTPDREIRARDRAERREKIRKKYLTVDSQNLRQPEREKGLSTEVLYRDENTVVYRTSPEMIFPESGQLSESGLLPVTARDERATNAFPLLENSDGTTSALPIQDEVLEDVQDEVLEDSGLILEEAAPEITPEAASELTPEAASEATSEITSQSGTTLKNEFNEVILEDAALPAEADLSGASLEALKSVAQKSESQKSDSRKFELPKAESRQVGRRETGDVSEARANAFRSGRVQGRSSVSAITDAPMISFSGDAKGREEESSKDGLEAVSEEELELIPALEENGEGENREDATPASNRGERSILKTSEFKRDFQVCPAAFKLPFQENTDDVTTDRNGQNSGNSRVMRYPVRGNSSSATEQSENGEKGEKGKKSRNGEKWENSEKKARAGENAEWGNGSAGRVSTRNYASGVRIQEFIPDSRPTETTSQRSAALTQNAGLAQNGGLAQNSGLTQNAGLAQNGELTQNAGLTQNGGLAQNAGLTQNVGLTQNGGLAQNSTTVGGATTVSPMVRTVSPDSRVTDSVRVADASQRTVYPVPQSYVETYRASQNSEATAQNRPYSSEQRPVARPTQYSAQARGGESSERSILISPSSVSPSSQGQTSGGETASRRVPRASEGGSSSSQAVQNTGVQNSAIQNSVQNAGSARKSALPQNSYPKFIAGAEPSYVQPFPEKNTANHKLKFVIPERSVFQDFSVRKTIEKGSLPWYAEYIQDLDVNEEHLFNTLRVLGDNKLSASRSSFHLMEAGIIASRPESVAQANRMFNIYENIEYYVLQKTRKVDARQDLPLKKKEELKAEIILNFMHENVIQEYRLEGTTMRNLLENGRYNCVTASILFCSLAEKAGLNVTAVELPGHAMCWVYLSDGERLEVETTCDTWFKYRNDPETQKRVICKLIRDASPQLKDQSDSALLSQVPHPISDKRLIAKIYYNRGVDLLAVNDYAGALEANAIAYCLDSQSETTFGNLLATMNNWAIALCKEGDYAAASALLKMGLKHKPDYPPFRNNHTHVYHYWVRDLYEKGQINEALHVADIAADEQPAQKKHFLELQNQIRQTIAVGENGGNTYR